MTGTETIANSEANTRYNGWTNYETWAVHLWISNEEPSYRYWRERAVAVRRLAVALERRTAKGLLADTLKNHFEEAAPELLGFWGDLLSAALSEVDWYELAEALLEDVD